MNTGDTIAAISTPPGRGGIGIIRLSGPSSVSIASKIFHSDTLNSFNTPNHAYVGQAIGPEGKPLDHCIATYFKAPHSYTGEDVVELCCHGSPVVLSAVRFTDEPATDACIALELELLVIVYEPDPPLTVTEVDWPETNEKLFWLNVSC